MTQEAQTLESVREAGSSSRLKHEFPRITLEEAINVAQAIEDANGRLPLPHLTPLRQ
jgi:hypothetical protein